MKGLEFVFIGTNDDECKYHAFYDKCLVCTIFHDTALYTGKRGIFKKFSIFLEEKKVWESLISYSDKSLEEMMSDAVMIWLMKSRLFI